MEDTNMKDFSEKRAWALLQNPSSGQIERSELLLLNAIRSLDKPVQAEIERWLREQVGKIRTHTSNFYVAWSTGYTLDDELLRFRNMGLIEVKEVQEGSPIWEVTEKGEKRLRERRTLLLGLSLETC
jgi:hypothetical protein